MHAQTVTPNTDPGSDKGEFVNYAGHYGEVLKLRGGWEIRPSMQGEAEVINHYPLDYGQPDRKASDFVPENFTRDSLIQLIILPWSASSSKTLVELKRLKIEDLKSSGVEFRILDDPFPGYGHMGRKWPKGTFEVLVAKPYLLSQLYTTSGAHLAILTTGWDTPPSTYISHHYDWMRMSLRDWVVPATGKEVPQTSGPVPARDIPEEGISLRVFAKPRIWMTWVAVTGMACLILGILGVTKLWEPLRRASLSLLIFSNAGALIGGLVGLCFWPFAWSSQHLTVPPAVACLFMPLLAWLAGRVRGRQPNRRAMIATAAWALASTSFLGYIGLAWNWGADWSAHVPANTAVNAFIHYMIAGVIFGFLDSDSSEIGGRRALLTLTLLLISSSTLWAQPGPVLIEKATPNPIESDARQKLAKHDLDRDSFIEQAKKELGKTQVLYKYQRVEIKGIFAKDLTDNTYHDLFDLELGASHLGEKGNDVTTPSWVQDVYNHTKDLKDLHADTYGKFTEAAQQTVEALRGQEVNEIVAHSWGTEIVYNAILHGDINPPRRLIVCGMPDRDKEKWLALSRHTGTEVVVYPNSRDPIAGAARLGGVLLDGLAAAGQAGDIGEIPTPRAAQFEAEWEAACRERPCNPHARQPAPPKFNPAYKGPSHNRLLYYKTMLKDGTIPFDESDAFALRDRQSNKIAAEADRLYAAAVGREVENLRPEPAKAKADKDFLGVWQQDADKIAAKARAVQDAEREARLARDKEREQLAREDQEREVRKKQAFRTEMDAEAASCGYRIHYDTDNETFLGFTGYIDRYPLGRRQVPFDFGDLKVVFLMTRVCHAIEYNPNQPPPPACNGAASLMHERVGRGDFLPKLEYLAAGPDGDYPSRSDCLKDILANADKITDAKSFDKVTASYQKRLSKRLAKEAKRDRERDERDRKERERGGNTAPPGNGGDGPDHFWDPSCNCWVRRY